VAEIPKGYQAIPEVDQKKAQAFFKQGKTVADAGQYDYAIEMYLQGLAIDPDARAAHEGLREISLKRKATGGKSLGMMECMKLNRPTRDDKANMLNAEKIMAYDPGNTDAMQKMLQNAHKGGYYDTVLWIGPILQRANYESKKPDYHKFVVLKDIYKSLECWDEAVEACKHAAQVRENDMELQAEYTKLAAMVTMTKGRYVEAGTEGGFRKMLNNADAQDKQIEQGRDIQSNDFLSRQLQDAEEQFKADPVEGKMVKLVDALEHTESLENENRACDLLQEWFEKTRQFRFRQRVGRIHIKQLERQSRAMRLELKSGKADARLAQDYEQFRLEQAEFELKEYSLWSEQYPTDMGFRYEMARRLFALKRFDEAIQYFQQAANDPKLKNEAGILLGRCFLESGFVDEAAEVLQGVISEYQLRGDKNWLEMYYWRARALEQKKEFDGAMKLLSQIAQVNFNYLDVQSRIKRLREEKAKM